MHFAYILFILLLTCIMGFAILDDSRCNYVYNHECCSSSKIFPVMEYKETNSQELCSVDNIKGDVTFTPQLAKKTPKSSGILKVNFTLPNAKCNYEVALLVNSSITNDRDCKNHIFHKTNSYEDEIHSADRTVCVLPAINDTTLKDCKKEKFSMWYENVFTGCYALRFTVDGSKFSVLGNKFVVTDYIRKEIVEPKFRCYYEDRIDDEKSKQELVTFALSISVHAGTAGMFLTLTPMSHPEETKENACVRYSEQPLYSWEISTDESVASSSAALKNCSLTTVQLNNETYTRDAECNFALRAPRNVSYCFKIGLHDERCNRQTIWKPPPDGKGGKPACAWLQTCTRIVKNTSVIEYNGILSGSKQINSSDDNIFLFLPIIIAVVTIVPVITIIVLFVCRVCTKNSSAPIYVNTNLRDFKIGKYNMEIESIETTDDEMINESRIIGNKKNDETEPIILLYARGTKSFMNLMSDFRDIIKIRCACRVRDWYDPIEWDVVASMGPSSWVTDLLRNEHRVLWIDTPRARNLLNRRMRNDYLVKSRIRDKDRNDIYEETIGDFRDLALPTILDSAKRNVGSLSYDKHFVVRLEGFETRNGKEQDPFEDLSPHTRYLIPHHLSELCSHLSSWRTNVNSERPLKKDEARLRERLVEIKNDLQSLETLH